MFTGLIEAVGEVRDVRRGADGIRLSIATSLVPELSPGESVAVNGVCLTVTQTENGNAWADIGPETARVTTLGTIEPGRVVNLERSLKVGDRLGGHFVQGHVDATGVVEAIAEDGEAHWLTISFPRQLASSFIPKGSVAVDGISLTVARLSDARFTVMIIPFTWSHTNLRTLATGDRVNLECDVIGKYVARTLELTGIEGRSVSGNVS